jgi:hypothetical protein
MPENVEFKIDDAKKRKIAEVFGLKYENVCSLYTKYYEPIEGIKYQYLAHMIRSMEVYFREKLKYNKFIITCGAAKPVKHPTNKSFSHYHRGQGFEIYYQEALSDKERRTHIAHELGHLFIIASRDMNEQDFFKEVNDNSVEPLSSILGLFTISDKNDHRYNMPNVDYNHETWMEILNDFEAIEKE